MEETKNTLKIADFADKSLLIVDDDNPLRDRLSRAMEKKGFREKFYSAARACNFQKEPVVLSYFFDFVDLRSKKKRFFFANFSFPLHTIF